MKIGIMQPYFFPYLGYFELIARTERWIVFDVVKYSSRSWMNRNRILHPRQGWQYVTAPVRKAPSGTAIFDISLVDKAAAHRRILRQIEHYKRGTPYFQEVERLIGAAFSVASDRLVDVNVAGLSAVCDYLGLAFNYDLCSELDLEFAEVSHAGSWALAIAQQLGATEYLNPPGGRSIFRQDEWDAASIGLSFTELPRLAYNCGRHAFIEHLSILDVLMWNDPAIVRRALMGD